MESFPPGSAVSVQELDRNPLKERVAARHRDPHPEGDRHPGHRSVADVTSGERRRILVVAPQPFYQDRGTPIALRQVLEALSQLGYAVDLLTFPLGEDIELPGLQIYRAGNPLGIKVVPIGFSLRKVVLDLSLIAALRARLASNSYVCVHAVEEIAMPAVILARRHGIPALYDMQSSLPEQLRKYAVARVSPVAALLRAVERWLLKRADFVVASVGLGDHVRAVAPGARVWEWRFPSGIVGPRQSDARALRRQLGLTSDAPVVVYSGTFEGYQGLDQLIAAVPRIRERVPAATFVLVGADAESRASAEAAAPDLVREGALKIADRQPRWAIPSYLAMADVLVSPRQFGENLPLKVFDYLAAGRPIVATDIPAHRTVLNDERALLVPPTPEGLADGVLSVLHDKEKATRLATAAHTYAVEHLGWKQFLDSVAEIYDHAQRHVPA